eukprot:CAMPEP_0182587332 /NCGR_PEP_ID=MMETSP1324-20130603/64789_1 /TAXON_ID=236786 /ORGANISM="Florenciella sp., Strain RCC1587" /LENGTH=67 /DNA_ID=CAMNT_0024804317 /DNA_START=17 /DNA_END=218 /DNA_ORIENTATION=+
MPPHRAALPSKKEAPSRYEIVGLGGVHGIRRVMGGGWCVVAGGNTVVAVRPPRVCNRVASPATTRLA